MSDVAIPLRDKELINIGKCLLFAYLETGTHTYMDNPEDSDIDSHLLKGFKTWLMDGHNGVKPLEVVSFFDVKNELMGTKHPNARILEIMEEAFESWIHKRKVTSSKGGRGHHVLL